MSESEPAESAQEYTETSSTLETLAEQLSAAMQAMLKALMALLLALFILLARALQALFTLVRFVLPLISVAVAGTGAALLFPTVTSAYGNDPPAALLALVAITATPTTLLLLARQKGKELTLWGICVGSGAIMLLARFLIERAPPAVLGLVPAIGLAASIFYIAFGQPAQPETPPGTDQGQEPNQKQDEGSKKDE